MHRITGTYVDPDANGSGVPGFTHGTPGVTGATAVTADWLNAVQEEICGVITGAGIALNPASNIQLFTAIETLIGEYSQDATFLNDDYSWGGTHQWSTPCSFVGLLTVGGLSSGSIACTTINTSGSQISCGVLSASGNIATSQNISIANATTQNFNFTGTKPVRALVFSWLGGGYTAEWAPDAAAAAAVRASSPNGGIYYKPIQLPQDAIVTQFSCRYYQQVDTSPDMTMELVRKPFDWSADVAVATLTAASPFATDNIAAVTGLSHTVDNTVGLYFLKATASDAVGDENYLYWASVVIDDPGPRNY
jgi:hypothetical protein